MSISGDLRVSATLSSCHNHHLRITSLTSRKPQVNFASFHNGGSSTNASFLNGGSSTNGITQKLHCISLNGQKPCGQVFSGLSSDYTLYSDSPSSEAESFLLNAINMNFFDRLGLAWKIIFPSPTTKKRSNARIAKQRLKMILFSDRCAVSDEAKKKIVNKVVHALSEFVEIESQDKVQLNVSTDYDLGTVYSVTVPVRRVKRDYQDNEDTGSMITNIEYKSTGNSSGSVDVLFDFGAPDHEIF